jgi:hypothetical protein
MQKVISLLTQHKYGSIISILYNMENLSQMTLLGSCFGAPKVSHEEAASAEVVSKRWPKVPFHGASAF